MKDLTTDLISQAKIAVGEAIKQEQWAVEAYARAYTEAMVEEQDGNRHLYTTKDGWDDGPLPYSLELDYSKQTAVFLFRDGGPTCDSFVMAQATARIAEAISPAMAALYFVRQLKYPSGRIAFLDGEQAAGLLLAVSEKDWS